MIAQTDEAPTYFANRALEQGNDALAHWLYEEGLAIWRALDDAPGIAHSLERLRTLEGMAEPRPERFGGGPVAPRAGAENLPPQDARVPWTMDHSPPNARVPWVHAASEGPEHSNV
jgi:hypothetical protein